MMTEVELSNKQIILYESTPRFSNGITATKTYHLLRNLVKIQKRRLEIKWNTSVLAYADDVNILGERIRSIRKNTEALVIASKEICLEVNAEKTTYMVISRDQNAG
jgi:hypothetical protein